MVGAIKAVEKVDFLVLENTTMNMIANIDNKIRSSLAG